LATTLPTICPVSCCNEGGLSSGELSPGELSAGELSAGEFTGVGSGSVDPGAGGGDEGSNVFVFSFMVEGSGGLKGGTKD